jgi:hypothetical protein
MSPQQVQRMGMTQAPDANSMLVSGHHDPGGRSTPRSRTRLRRLCSATADFLLYLLLLPRRCHQEQGLLSGGEKSFAGLVFLCAVAHAAAVPVRMLDEFEVFQDAANRKLSTTFLLEAALQKNEHGAYSQFILLSPNEVDSAVNAEQRYVDITKIIEMPAPERT